MIFHRVVKDFIVQGGDPTGELPSFALGAIYGASFTHVMGSLLSHFILIHRISYEVGLLLRGL